MTSHDKIMRASRRLLMTAYHYNREFSMESRLSWQRAQQAAEQYEVTVVCGRTDQPPESGVANIGATAERRVRTAVLPLSPWERRLMSWAVTYYAGYRLWHGRVRRLAQRLHARRPFDLVHHVSFCGYREPGGGSALGVPFVWGPVGGTHPFPVRFLGQLDLMAALRELMRNAVNWRQLRFDGRIRRAMGAAAEVLAANREVAGDLQAAFGLTPTVQLETGVSEMRRDSRPRRNERRPLRILWSGRLRAWKGLPLLLRGLAKLPADCRYELRVLGEGKCLARWQRLAVKLGLVEHIDWVGWPAYSGQLAHYEWADVFAFTSLRDTSGTGLLEALAAGAPIIGIDHQGAADVMTAECAIRVSAKSAAAAIEGFRSAIERVAGDADLLARLSDGALARATHYYWGREWGLMRDAYERALGHSRPETVELDVADECSDAALQVRPLSQGAYC